ncbi:XdhC family protein [Ancylobacter vacuolatus]|uniref:CTP:molybdopterin cytidylyltransferase MocA/xanthine/CO dehydrogenase XdhC/CoxF family maturation factor n=1 Tax=Ancylobacter vacuolatus TaxID=223389 RepID=A0ABU0DNN4_9HYPH|nr:XdhC family protein [Ancylobacter vacuolatus]MDQ0350077.1 CTP:molybdopterin cytidylyltransferase MocA/xanthine/CO dehydrogenase XdhC/CoxF family maturation factor [Ancylobacter vacuolatus]
MELSLLEALNTERAARRPIVLVTDLDGGAQRLVSAADVAGDPLAEPLAEALRSGRSGRVEVEGSRLFLTVHLPSPRLVITGAVHISQALAPMAKAVGFEVIIVDPRTAFASEERFPGVEVRAQWPQEALAELVLDPFTAVAVLAHDPKIDDPALEAALTAGCFYVGALGSRKSHAGRVARLAERGVPRAALERIRAPIGLDIGAANPAEIAVSILAQIVGELRRRPARPPAALVLAAGQGTRLPRAHKLTLPLGGVPLVRRVVETALAARARPVIVVTGHEADAVRAALTGLDVTFAHNPDFAQGLSTSLKAGVAALPREVERVVVMLGDMPRVEPSLVDRLADALDPARGRLAAVPVAEGRQGNPVALARALFPALKTLQGDVGARQILAQNADFVVEVPVEGEGAFLDIDTSEDLEALEIHEIAAASDIDADAALEAMKAEDA